MQAGQHAEAQQVELDQAGGGAVILVPLQHGAAGHPCPFHRAYLADRPVTDHHPARVDAQVTRQPLHLPGKLDHGFRDAGIGWNRLARSYLVRPGVLLTG